MSVIFCEKSEAFSRTRMLYSDEGVKRFAESSVAVFGLGGVGGHCAEALARSAVGTLMLIDSDVVGESNLNRQIIATLDTLGMKKTKAMRERIASINPDCRVIEKNIFVLPETIAQIDLSGFDYVVDAIDTVAGKIAIIGACSRARVPVISSMGAGNKLDPTLLELCDIYSTSVCPLARVMRRELRKIGVSSLPVVYSKEQPAAAVSEEIADGVKKRVTGSNAVVPAAAGLIIASHVLNALSKRKACE